MSTLNKDTDKANANPTALVNAIGNLRASFEAASAVLDQISKDYIVLSNEYENIAQLNNNWASAMGFLKVKEKK